MKITHTETTTITDKRTGDEFIITTTGRIEFLVHLGHRFHVWNLKRHLRYFEKISIVRGEKTK